MKKRFIAPISLLIPFIVSAQGDSATIDVNPTHNTDFMQFIESLGNWLFTIALVAAPLVILIGAFMFVTAAGNPEKVKTGRKIIIWAIIGLAIAGASKGIIAFIKALLT